MIVAVLGGGQLGRMLALSGYPLGLQFRFLDPAADAPTGQLADLIVGEYTDEGALARLLGEGGKRAGVVTYEFENVPAGTAAWLAQHAPPPVFPPASALENSQDRVLEKTLFRRLGIPTPEFAAVDDEASFRAAVERIGLPAVLKTRRFGYDGKGQRVIRTAGEAEAAYSALAGAEGGLILEAFVPFDREVSIIAVRGRTAGNGAAPAAFYPVTENVHDAGILRSSTAPARDSEGEVQRTAERYAAAVMEELGYVGVLAIEFFERGGVLLANEMAPRVHNSGHWTIDGAVTSQFENHLRAILGWPLGSTAMRGGRVCTMLNLIGRHPPAEAFARVPGVHVHLYGKEPRPGRKVGHVTLSSERPDVHAGVVGELRRMIEAAAGEGR